jgi:hypothetical protein
MVAVGWVTNSIACHMRPMLSLASAGSVMGTVPHPQAGDGSDAELGLVVNHG